jgi:hypothetical protein
LEDFCKRYNIEIEEDITYEGEDITYEGLKKKEYREKEKVGTKTKESCPANSAIIFLKSH